jgi:hypothetical protein
MVAKQMHGYEKVTPSDGRATVHGPVAADILTNTMRRWIAILLLMLLPVQAIWAAAEPYCQHEHGVAAHHLGHHEHEHHGDDHGDGQDSSKKASPMADHDHHCCASLSLLPPSSLAMPGTLSSAKLVAAPLARYADARASRIERPQWPSSL